MTMQNLLMPKSILKLEITKYIFLLFVGTLRSHIDTESACQSHPKVQTVSSPLLLICAL